MPVTCLRYVPTNLQWVLGCTPQGDIFCFDPNHEGFETLIVEENQQTYCLDVSLDGTELATAGRDTEIRLYSLQSGQKLTGFESQGNGGKPQKCIVKSGKSKPTFLINLSNTLLKRLNFITFFSYLWTKRMFY